jgi:phage portal protein BeeE
MGLLSRLSEFAFGDDAPVSRVEPTFVAAAPGAVTRSSSDDDAGFWAGSNFSIPSVTGIQINQWSALNSSPVVAATTMLAEDVAKLPWTIKRNASGEAQQEEKGSLPLRPSAGAERVAERPRVSRNSFRSD